MDIGNEKMGNNPMGIIAQKSNIKNKEYELFCKLLNFSDCCWITLYYIYC